MYSWNFYIIVTNSLRTWKKGLMLKYKVLKGYMIFIQGFVKERILIVQAVAFLKWMQGKNMAKGILVNCLLHVIILQYAITWNIHIMQKFIQDREIIKLQCP